MNDLYGADVVALERLADLLQREAGHLSAIASALGHRLNVTSWDGPDARTARQTWSSTHRHRIAAASSALHDGARILRQNAAEQRGASVAAGAGGPGVAHASGSGLGGGVGPIGSFPGAEHVLEWTLDGLESVFKDGVRAGGQAWRSGFGLLWNERTGHGVHAAFASRVLGPMFLGASVLSAGINGYGDALRQAERDRSDPTLDDAEATARGLGAGLFGGASAFATSWAGGKAFAAAGAVAGTLLLGPGAGTVAGALVGGVIGSVAGGLVQLGMEHVTIGSMTIDVHISEFGADAGDAVVDGYRAVTGVVSDARDVGSRLLDGGAEIASGIGDKLWPF